MLALLNAINTKFTTDSVLPGLFPGGLKRDMAPTGTPMPYVVTNVESAPSTTSYGEVNDDDIAVRFVAFGVGHDAVRAAIQTLDGKFKSTILTLATGVQFNIVRMNDPIPVRTPDVDATGQEIWSWFVTYVFSVQH